MFIITTWDGLTSRTSKIKADTLCQARIKARRKHCMEQGVSWCEITRVSHRLEVL